MDVITFHFKKLPEKTQQLIRVDARKKHVWAKFTPVKQWFLGFCPANVITKIHGTEGEKRHYIVDYKIQMPKDKYVEFCLTWL